MQNYLAQCGAFAYAQQKGKHSHVQHSHVQSVDLLSSSEEVAANVVVSRRATSVVPVVGVRTVVILPVPQVHSNRDQMS